MTLTPEQKQAVTAWIATGDNLSQVQKKLIDQFQITMTYRDVRFLVDDLNLELKDPAPKVDTTDLSKPAAPKPGPAGTTAPHTAPAPGAGADAVAEDEPATEAEEENFDEALGAGAGTVKVEVDKITVLPGALASGTVTFSDGVTGKWVVDQYGRPGFTEISKPGYRPTPADGQAFVQELSAQLQKRGF